MEVIWEAALLPVGTTEEHKNLIQDSRSPGLDVNLGLP
jgi:hypothetical protein